MVGMLISGTSNTLVLKYQDNTVAAGHPYMHPFLQTAFMFFGEFICLGVFQLKRAYFRANNPYPTLGLNDEVNGVDTGRYKINIHPWLLAIPASLDLIASTLTFISLTMIDASVYQMLRGLIVIFVPLISMILLDNK